MKKIRQILFLGLCFLMAGFCLAQEDMENEAESQAASELSFSVFHELRVDLGYSLPVGVRDQRPVVGLAYRALWEEAYLQVGLHTSIDTFDLLLEGAYTPGYLFFVKTDDTKCNAYQFGGNGKIHLRTQGTIAFESDVVLNGVFQYLNSVHRIELVLCMGGLWKHSVVYSAKNHPMDDFSVNVMLALGKDMGFGSIYGTMSTYDMYDYPLFVTPIYKVGLYMPLWKKLGNEDKSIMLDVYARITMCDQFTSSPYMGDALIGLALEYSF